MDLAAYQQQVLALLPSGPAWQGPKLRELVASFATEVHRLAEGLEGSEGLKIEMIPTTADELLEDYERVVGLPYRGFGLAATLEERRGDVLSILIAQGGQSKAYFLGIIAARGHVNATITDGYRPFCAGSPCGTPLYDLEWAYHWHVTFTESTSDPLLEFLLDRYKPAHTTVSFEYA